jgi:hypothetical protein
VWKFRRHERGFMAGPEVALQLAPANRPSGIEASRRLRLTVAYIAKVLKDGSLARLGRVLRRTRGDVDEEDGT